MCSLQLCQYVKIRYGTQSISNTAYALVNNYSLTTEYKIHVHNVTYDMHISVTTPCRLPTAS